MNPFVKWGTRQNREGVANPCGEKSQEIPQGVGGDISGAESWGKWGILTEERDATGTPKERAGQVPR